MTIEHPDHADDHKPGGVDVLGELPSRVRRERDETYEQEVKPLGPPGIVEAIPGTPLREIIEPPILLPKPTDVRGQNRALFDAAGAPIGLPAVDFVIQTMFDARPINGNDWQFLNVVALDPNGDVGAAVQTATISFRIPEGRLAIIRHFKWTSNQVLVLPSPPAPGDDINLSIPVFMSLGISGFIQRGYERIFQQEGERDAYAIGFEKETIDFTATVNTDFTGSIVGYQPAFFVEMYGNLIDTRGREKQYEPANVYKEGLLK